MSKKIDSKKIKNKNNIKPKKIKLSINNTVTIAIKPYKGDTENGIVKKVLTKKKYHSRGHKVILKSGKVGRIIKIIKFASKSMKKKSKKFMKKISKKFMKKISKKSMKKKSKKSIKKKSKKFMKKISKKFMKKSLKNL